MMRRWIIALAVASCAADTLLAQDGAGTRYRQRQPQEQMLEGRGRVHQDPYLKPAAVAQEQARRRSPQRQPSQKSTSGGIFGGLKLPNLLPQSMRGGNSQEPSDAPMPYDPVEVGPQQGAARPAQRTTQQRGVASRSMTPLRQQQMSGRAAQPQARMSQQPNRATQTPVRSAQPQTQLPTSRIARSSPTPSMRRNELAEALSGLAPQEVQQEAETEEAPIEPDAIAEETEIAPPSVDDSEELPSYLREAPSVVSTKRAARSSPSVRPQAPTRDLRDVLLGNGAASSAPAQGGRTAEEPEAPETDAIIADADEADEPQVKRDDLVEPPMPSTTLPTPSSSRPVVAKKDAVATFRPRPSASKPKAEPPAQKPLGDIVAEEPNAAFEAEPPAAEKAEKGSTARIQSKPPLQAAAPARAAACCSPQANPSLLRTLKGPNRLSSAARLSTA
jgi:hypothetical protein